MPIAEDITFSLSVTSIYYLLIAFTLCHRLPAFGLLPFVSLFSFSYVATFREV